MKRISLWCTLAVLVILLASILGACGGAPKTTAPATTAKPATTAPATTAAAPTTAAPKTSAAPTTAAMKIPPILTFSTAEVGASGYMQTGFIGEAIMQKYGNKVRTVPAGTDLPRLQLVKAGGADCAWQVGTSNWFAQEGLFEYAELAWGPQPVQILRYPLGSPSAVAVRGDSKILTPADLKGKKVARHIGQAHNYLQSSGTMAFGGVTWADVTPYDVNSFDPGVRAVMENKIDASAINPWAPLAYEFEALPCGLRLLALPHNDAAGWARYLAVYPAMTKAKYTYAAGVKKGDTYEGAGGSYPAVTALASLDENTAYFITKAMQETFDMYKGKNEIMALAWPMEYNWVYFDQFDLPFHPGAVRYYKEIGMWNDQREALNQKRLQHQKDMKELWEKTVDASVAKKIKFTEFPKFWLEARKAAGLPVLTAP